MKTLTLTFFVIISSLLSGQTKKHDMLGANKKYSPAVMEVLNTSKSYDTLLLANKKYYLEIEKAHNVCPYDFPFAIAESNYTYSTNKKKKYRALDYTNCKKEAFYTDPNFLEFFTYKYDTYKAGTFYLQHYEDSLAMELNNFRNIYLKKGNEKYHIENMQLMMVLDSNILTYNIDMFQYKTDIVTQLNEVLNPWQRPKLKYIILNQMMYVDKKSKLQLIPRQFIITLK